MQRPTSDTAHAMDVLVLQQAAEWCVVLADKHASESDHAQWQVWLNAHPHHQSAWDEVQALQAPFAKVAAFGNQHAAKAALLSSRGLSRRAALKLLGLGGITVVSGYFASQYSVWRDWITNIAAEHASYRVAIGKTQLFTLSEGSKLWLNTNSQAEVAYSLALRRVTLRAGELLVETAKDHATLARPFVVDTVHGRIVAMGTRFTVRLVGNRTFVAVFDGAVSVTPAHATQTVVIASGYQLEFTAQQWLPITPADKAHEAWTRGMLLADNRRLDDFIAELARYRSGNLLVANDVAHLRVIGAYPLNDTDRILDSLTEALPVRLKQVNATDIQLVKR